MKINMSNRAVLVEKSNEEYKKLEEPVKRFVEYLDIKRLSIYLKDSNDLLAVGDTDIDIHIVTGSLVTPVIYSTPFDWGGYRYNISQKDKSAGSLAEPRSKFEISVDGVSFDLEVITRRAFESRALRTS